MDEGSEMDFTTFEEGDQVDTALNKVGQFQAGDETRYHSRINSSTPKPRNKKKKTLKSRRRMWWLCRVETSSMSHSQTEFTTTYLNL